MLKKLMALSLLVILLISPLACLGETVTVEPLLSYRTSVTAVSGTSYVIVSDKHSSLKGVFSTDGAQLTPYLYNNLSYLSLGFLIGYDEAGVNNRALVHADGVVLIDAEYGDYVNFGRHWILAYVLSEATAEDYTYKRGKAYYNVDSLDLYYVGDPADGAELVGTLAPEAYASATFHGDFIAIQAQDDSITLYDRNFQTYDFPMEKTTTSIFGVVDYDIVNNATGEILGEGYVSAAEQTISGETYLIVTRYDYKGSKVSGIIDLDGNVIMPIEYTISSVSGKNVVVTEGKLKGLYSIELQRLIVPCEFNNIMTSKVSVDKCVFNGYVAVENGSLRGYYDINAGELSCEIKYPRSDVTTVGCTTYWKTEEGTYILAAADGVETEVEVDSIYSKLRGDGHLLVASKDGYYGVIDWHGNIVLPFEHKNVITITDDSKALIRTSTGSELDAIIFGE